MPRVHYGSISVDVSPDWSLSTVVLLGPVLQTTDTPLLIQSQAQQAFQHNIVATVEKIGADETLINYVQRQLQGFRQAGVNRQELVAPEDVRLSNSCDGMLWEHMVSGPTGQLVGQIQLVSIKDGFAYTVIASCLYGPSYKKERENLRQILLSFQ